MSTQGIEQDQATSKVALSAEQQARVAEFAEIERQHSSEAPLPPAEQQARAAAFAARERQHSSEAPASPGPWDFTTGTPTYSVSLSDSGDGFATLDGYASNDLTNPSGIGQWMVAKDDWIGVFANRNLVFNNPQANRLGGKKGVFWVSNWNGGGITTDVQLQAGCVAAYLIKNCHGDYMPAAITPPYEC